MVAGEVAMVVWSGKSRKVAAKRIICARIGCRHHMAFLNGIKKF